MSQNNSQKTKFQVYTSNQTRGHADFVQAGYPQQYQFPPGALSGVSQANELSKVQAAQQQQSSGMYSGPAAQAQAQQAMGPSPSPQQTASISGQQQLSRAAHVSAMSSYYQPRIPRNIPGMGRTPLTTVVNQGNAGGTGANQQSPSTAQFSHAIQIVSPHTFPHPMQTLPFNAHQLTASQMYQQRTYSPQPYSFISPTSQFLQWSNYSNPTPPNSNGFYQSHGSIHSFNAMPPQLPPQMAGSQQPVQQQPLPPTQNRKKVLAIINPATGKNIFENASEEGIPPRPNPLQEKESENADPNICVQFATQVAATLANNDKSETPTKSPSMMDTQVLPDPQLCSANEVESLDDNDRDIYQDPRSRPCHEQFYNISSDSNILEENSYKSEKHSLDNVDFMAVTEPEETNQHILSEEDCNDTGVITNIEGTNVVTSGLDSLQEKNLVFCNVQELNKVNAQLVLDMEKISPESVQGIPISDFNENCKSFSPNEEKCETAVTVNTLKNQDKPLSAESKKNKTRKKKDLNKRGESKEGGEMDAFLDKSSEEDHIPPPPPVLDELQLSPVPVVDSEVLDSIPLPDEPVPSLNIDKIPVEDNIENEAVDAPSSKVTLKYSYKEDQWSPINIEGKKQYDRDFLLELQAVPMSVKKPTNLPNLDVIRDKAYIQKLTEVNRAAPMSMPVKTYNDPFMPVYARGGAPRPPHPSLGRRSQQGGGRGGMEKPKKVISFSSSLNQSIKLHESENAWKPTHKSDATTEETIEIQELYRKVRGILNKLTPQKFECLVEQVKGFDINTEEKLKGVIDLVFEKAIDEPNFSVPYANMCKQLALIQVPLFGQPGINVNFRKLLLSKCQNEFEQDTRDELKRGERMKAIEQADQDKKKELKLILDEEEKKTRYRQLGNIRFIGELFKLGMLTKAIMHDCIQKLLAQRDEESLECLCRLLKTIGKELDTKTGSEGKSRDNSPMDEYFAKMQHIVKERLTSSRVRFMLQDVADLKRSNWVPRRDENNPKTIDQIHKEMEREAREQQQSYQNLPCPATAYPKRMNPDDRRKGMGRNAGTSEDGWIATSKSKGIYNIDPMKLKLTKPDEVESMRLGPGGRGPQMWGRGSSGGNKSILPEEKSTAALTANRYSALADQTLTPNFEGRRGSQRSAASSRESSRGRNGGGQMPPVRKTPSTSKERESLLETVKGLTRTGQESRPPVQNVEPAPKKAPVVDEQITIINGKQEPTTAYQLRGPELNEDEMEKRTKPLIDEFLHNADYEEAIKCTAELCSSSTVQLFIESAINQVLERSSQARNLLGQLLYWCLFRSIFPLEQFQIGIGRVLNNVDDYALDIPLIWDYMGEILEPLIEDNKAPLTFLKEILEPCRPSLTAAKLVSSVLHCAAKKKGTIKLGEKWRESGLEWKDFLDSSENVSEFIKTHKLEFTLAPTIAPALEEELSPEDLRKELGNLLQKNEKNESIFDWIDANVSRKTMSEPFFIRALVTAVHENAIQGSGANCELDHEKLRERFVLITQYVERKENLELQALYAIQSLINHLDQPKGVLRHIFDLLYDDEVITDDTFKRWEQSEDPNEMEGKGVALLSVTPFITWLREDEESDPQEEDDEKEVQN